MLNKQSTLQKRVDRGVRWLDGRMGREGWLPRIDGESLNLASGNTCMIGQLFPQTARSLYNNFEALVYSGKLTKKEATQRGFLLPRSSFFPWVPTQDDYATLTDTWLDTMARLKTPESVVSHVQIKDLEKVPVRARGKNAQDEHAR